MNEKKIKRDKYRMDNENQQFTMIVESIRNVRTIVKYCKKANKNKNDFAFRQQLKTDAMIH